MIFYTHERNFGCRLMEYVYRGLRTVSLENELLRVTLLADKGSDILEFLYKPLDVDFMWRSPNGVRNPAGFIPTSHHASSAFLDYYAGGWQDCFPTGGQPCTYGGLPFGAHGEIPTIPWNYRILEDSPERVALQFWVRTYRTPFLVEKQISLERGRSVLHFQERIVNEGRVRMELMWGQHPAFGPPFLDDSCIIDLAGARVHCRQLTPQTRFIEGAHEWPHVPGKDGSLIDLRSIPEADVNSSDTIFLTDLPAGWYALTNRRQKVGFGMAWPLEVFPALWFWQVYGDRHGGPFYGRTYNIALEPFSSSETTIVDAIAAGEAHVLEPGASLEASFVAVAYAGIDRVNHITPDGEVIP